MSTLGSAADPAKTGDLPQSGELSPVSSGDLSPLDATGAPVMPVTDSDSASPSAELGIRRIAEFVMRNFGEEIGAGDPVNGESAADVVIRLLSQLRDKRYPLQVTLLDAEKYTASEAQKKRRQGNALRVIASGNEILRLEANDGDDSELYSLRVKIQEAVAAYRKAIGIDPNDGQ